MRIYFSGICGTGLGPLALMAAQAGHEVVGSDLAPGAITPELEAAGIKIHLGPQDGDFLQAQLKTGLDWFVHTSALPTNHPELTLAQSANLKITKRDDLTAHLIKEKNLKLIAIAGTHGKTTTTAMIVYVARKLNLPVSYVVGTTLGFAPSGAYHPGDQYFIYEADEYDRNFLKFHPWLSLIPSISYDHPDVYKTPDDYLAAFDQFKSQSNRVFTSNDLNPAATDTNFKNLSGPARRLDAALALIALLNIAPNSRAKIIRELNNFPGVGRRFERLADGFYSDYAHHPEEIAATISVALEELEKTARRGLVVVYEPHQNTRQHEVRDGYFDAFIGADRIFWLPTYLTREDPNLPVLTPTDFIQNLANGDLAELAEPNDELFRTLLRYRDDGYLILLMTAGPADPWLRERLKNEN